MYLITFINLTEENMFLHAPRLVMGPSYCILLVQGIKYIFFRETLSFSYGLRKVIQITLPYFFWSMKFLVCSKVVFSMGRGTSFPS